MSRPKSPDGHRHHVNIKLSDAEAEAIDAARGDLERGPWMRQAALSVAHRDSGIPQSKHGKRAAPEAAEASHRRSVARRSDPSLRKKPDEVVDAAIAEQDAQPLVPIIRDDRAADCPHPKARRNKGLCGACGTYVGK